jgi:hypothetical protein
MERLYKPFHESDKWDGYLFRKSSTTWEPPYGIEP